MITEVKVPDNRGIENLKRLKRACQQTKKTMEGIPDKVSEVNRMILTQRDLFLLYYKINQQKSLWKAKETQNQNNDWKCQRHRNVLKLSSRKGDRLR